MITLNNNSFAATFSKDGSFYGANFQLKYIEEGCGARVKGNDGKWYLDFVCGLGGNFLGYGNVGWEQYVNMWLRKGTAFSLPHRLEYEVATKLCRLLNIHVSYWQGVPLQVRWVKTGSDACEAAIRLARAVTGKQHVLSYGYHGYHTDFVSMTPPAHGITPELSGYMHPIKYNDVDDLFAQYGRHDDIAAVIVEQPLDEPVLEWYDRLRTFCDQRKALLIIDEVVTGVRYARGGAAELYGVEPDLVCMGKALGNGLPIAALVGPKEYMDWFNPMARPNHDPVFVSSTNAGDPLSLASANWILDYIADGRYLTKLWSLGTQLVDGLRKSGYTVLGNAPRSLVQCKDNVERGEFIQRMAHLGVLMNRPNFINMSHTEQDVECAVNAARKVRQLLDQYDDTGGAWAERKYWENEQPLVMFTNR